MLLQAIVGGFCEESDVGELSHKTYLIKAVVKAKALMLYCCNSTQAVTPTSGTNVAFDRSEKKTTAND